MKLRLAVNAMSNLSPTVPPRPEVQKRRKPIAGSSLERFIEYRGNKQRNNIKYLLDLLFTQFWVPQAASVRFELEFLFQNIGFFPRRQVNATVARFRGSTNILKTRG